MIVFHNVDKKFGISNQVLFNIDIKLNLGELVFFVGNAGSGKSTILKMIAGMENPTTGQVHVKGRILSAVSYNGMSIARKEMGIILNEFDLTSNLTIQENLEVALIIKKIEKKERDRLIIQILTDLGIPQKRHFLASELSSQEKKVGAIARALVVDPEIVIADDLFETLEPEWLEKVKIKLLELYKKGATIIIATRYKELAVKFPVRKRIISLAKGKITSDEMLNYKSGDLEGALSNV